MIYVSDIKLIRTDITLDLNQKAGKVYSKARDCLRSFGRKHLKKYGVEESPGLYSRYNSSKNRGMPLKVANTRTPKASYCCRTSPKTFNLISCEPIIHVSDIKMIRTDSILDLSQKAEKVIRYGFHWHYQKNIFSQFFSFQKSLLSENYFFRKVLS
ncbi:hypothetical protein ACOSP7_020581 [Xanthoceras sorbifolium]